MVSDSLDTDDPIKSPIKGFGPLTTPTATPFHSTPTKMLETKLQPKDHSHLLLSEQYQSSISKTRDEFYTGYSDTKSPKVKQESKSLPEEALVGLKQAFDLISTLSSINVQLQEEVARLTQENLVSVCVGGGGALSGHNLS